MHEEKCKMISHENIGMAALRLSLAVAAYPKWRNRCEKTLMFEIVAPRGTYHSGLDSTWLVDCENYLVCLISSYGLAQESKERIEETCIQSPLYTLFVDPYLS